MSDYTELIARAEQVQEGVTPGPWKQVGFGNIHAEPVGEHPPVAKMWKRANGDFIASARTLVPELVSALKETRAKLDTATRVARQFGAEVVRLIEASDV